MPWTAGPVPLGMDGHTLFVDGSPLNVIEVKQADVHPTTIVHIPEIDVVVAGDSVYNEIHAMLGLSTPGRNGRTGSRRSTSWKASSLG